MSDSDIGRELDQIRRDYAATRRDELRLHDDLDRIRAMQMRREDAGRRIAMSGWPDPRDQWIALGVAVLFIICLCLVVWLAGGCSGPVQP